MAKESFLHRMERNRRARQAQPKDETDLMVANTEIARIDRQEWIANWRSGAGNATGDLRISRSAA